MSIRGRENVLPGYVAQNRAPKHGDIQELDAQQGLNKAHQQSKDHQDSHTHPRSQPLHGVISEQAREPHICPMQRRPEIRGCGLMMPVRCGFLCGATTEPYEGMASISDRQFRLPRRCGLPTVQEGFTELWLRDWA